MNANHKTSMHNQYLTSMQESSGGHIDRFLKLNSAISDRQLEGKEYADNNRCFEGTIVGVEDLADVDDDDNEEDDDDDDGTDQTNLPQGSESTGRWTRLEHELFLEALKKYGKEWKKVAGVVKTRTVVQTRTHAQKYFQKLNKSNDHIDYVGGVSKTMDYMDEDIVRHEPSKRFSGSENNPISILKDTNSTNHYQHSSKKGPKAENRRSVLETNNDSNQSSYYDTQEYYDSIDLATIVSELHKTPASNKDYIDIIPIPSADLFPQPSPAACGKRKHAEIAAAQMLAASSSANRRNESNIFDDNNNSNRKNRLGLFLTIQDSELSVNSYDEPGTPWETAVQALENRYVNVPTKVNRSSSFSTYNMAPVPVSTPSEQRVFISKVRSLILDGDLGGLTSLLSAAEFSAQTYVENTEEKFKRTEELDSEAIVSEKQGIIHFDGYERQDSFESVSNLMSVYTPDVLMNNKFVHPLSVEEASNIKSNSSAYFDRSKLAQKSRSFSLVAQSLNRTDDVKRSILMEIASFRSTQKNNDAILYSMCMLLLEHGASPTLIDIYGNSCLHYAAKCGNAHIGRLLLTRGCPLNLQNKEGDAATHIAAKTGHAAFFEMLADLGANFHLRNGNSTSALDLVGYTSGNINQRNEMRKIMLTAEPRLRSLVLYHEDFLEHTARRPSDWEGPDRLEEIMKRLSDKVEFPDYEVEISNNFDKANVVLLGRAHSAEYIAFVNMLAKQVRLQELQDSNADDGSKVNKIVPFTPQIQRFLLRQPSEELKTSESCDTSFSSGTLNAARRAAGAVAHAVDRVMLGRNRNVFCAIRPPGHHAGFRGLLDGSNSCGFCIFNNVAAGALHALEEHNCERVAIIDIDVHHGNGTEDIVRRYAHPSRLFFFSLHLYDKETQLDNMEVTAEIEAKAPVPGGKYEFYPGTGAKDDYIHNIINVPLTPLWAIDQESNSSVKESNSVNLLKTKGLFTGREGYRQAIEQRLIPSLRAFNPSLILLSIGFDASAGDVGNIRHFVGQPSKAGIDLKPEDFSWTTTEIMKIADICCGGRLVSVLEGGYGEYIAPNPSKPAIPPPTTRGTNKTNSTVLTKAHEQPLKLQTDSIMNRNILATAAAAHVHALIDPYGQLL